MDTAAINNMDKVRDDFCDILLVVSTPNCKYVWICISYIQNYFYYHFIINICVHVHSNRDEKGEMFIIFSGHAQASDPDPEIAAKHGQDARQ